MQGPAWSIARDVVGDLIWRRAAGVLNHEEWMLLLAFGYTKGRPALERMKKANGGKRFKLKPVGWVHHSAV